MVRQSVKGDSFPFCAGLAIVAVGVNGDAASGKEFAPDLNIFRLHQANQILHNNVHTVLMEIPMVSEAEQIQL